MDGLIKTWEKQMKIVSLPFFFVVYLNLLGKSFIFAYRINITLILLTFIFYVL